MQHRPGRRYRIGMAEEWRRVVAALGNAESRRSYAEVVLGIEPDPSKRGERARTILAAAGLIRQDSDGAWRPNDDTLPALTDDVALLRRYLVDHGVLSRTPDGSSYRRGANDHPSERST
ncbi:MAG: hypothetical protein QOD27_428 [Microbacteriaceae bacterium]|nr:hypothetical protein [Microbacteriaceae bacterium]